MKPEEEKSEAEKHLNIAKYKIQELEKKRNALLDEFDTKGQNVFTDNSLKDLIECKENLVENYAKKEVDLRTIESKLDNLRNEKDSAQKQLDQLMNAEKDNSEVTIKLKDCREKIMAIVTVNLIGNESDERYNDKVVIEAERQLTLMTKELDNETKRFDDQENILEMRLNNTRADLSSKMNTNTMSAKELDAINPKIVNLSQEVAELAKKVKIGKPQSSRQLEELNEKIENLRESSTMNSETLDRKTKELVEISGQITDNTKNKELVLKKQDLDDLNNKLGMLDTEFKSHESKLLT